MMLATSVYKSCPWNLLLHSYSISHCHCYAIFILLIILLLFRFWYFYYTMGYSIWNFAQNRQQKQLIAMLVMLLSMYNDSIMMHVIFFSAIFKASIKINIFMFKSPIQKAIGKLVVATAKFLSCNKWDGIEFVRRGVEKQDIITNCIESAALHIYRVYWTRMAGLCSDTGNLQRCITFCRHNSCITRRSLLLW